MGIDVLVMITGTAAEVFACVLVALIVALFAIIRPMLPRRQTMRTVSVTTSSLVRGMATRVTIAILSSAGMLAYFGSNAVGFVVASWALLTVCELVIHRLAVRLRESRQDAPGHDYSSAP